MSKKKKLTLSDIIERTASFLVGSLVAKGVAKGGYDLPFASIFLSVLVNENFPITSYFLYGTSFTSFGLLLSSNVANTLYISEKYKKRVYVKNENEMEMKLVDSSYPVVNGFIKIDSVDGVFLPDENYNYGAVKLLNGQPLKVFKIRNGISANISANGVITEIGLMPKVINKVGGGLINKPAEWITPPLAEL